MLLARADEVIEGSADFTALRLSAYGTKRTYRICPLSGAKRTSASDCLPITIYEYTA